MKRLFMTAFAALAVAVPFSAIADTTYYRDGVNVTGTLVAFDHNCDRFQFFDLDANTVNALLSTGGCATGFIAGSGDEREERERIEAEAAAAAAAEAEATL
jgi:hypothetical protein